MPLTPWDPWKEWARLRAETDRLWDQFLEKLTHAEAGHIDFLPDVDFVETRREYRLYVSVPGFVEEDIDLVFGERSLTVRGERQPPYDSSHTRRQLSEWRYGYFERRFEFAHPVRPDAARADYEAGVLTIVLPKCKATPRRDNGGLERPQG